MAHGDIFFEAVRDIESYEQRVCPGVKRHPAVAKALMLMRAARAICDHLPGSPEHEVLFDSLLEAVEALDMSPIQSAMRKLIERTAKVRNEDPGETVLTLIEYDIV